LEHQRDTGGFTLVEIMIVVVLIGILSSIALPSFGRYMRQARTAEAALHLNMIWAGAATYYAADHADSATLIQPRMFPQGSTPLESAIECACQPNGVCSGSSLVYQADPVWSALVFNIPDPHKFIPSYTGVGIGGAAVFTAVAQSDLDCDGILGTFQRNGAIDSYSGDTMGQSIPFIINGGE
jgi:type IV pilus assembly protein PilE